MLLHLFTIPWPLYIGTFVLLGSLLGGEVAYACGLVVDIRQIERGIKYVAQANSDVWSVTKLGKPERWSWCLVVRDAKTFMYEYTGQRSVYYGV